jgi:hypothetical protein
LKIRNKIVFKKIMATFFLNKESLTTKSTLIFVGLTTAVCGGYILFLAIVAPQQLAEATTAATNVVCNGCVGSSDIGDNSIRSVDIQNGQVLTADIGAEQVRAGDIGAGQVTSNKISDIDGVNSVDIVDGQVGSADIGDGEITAVDIDDNEIQPNIQIVQGNEARVPPGNGVASLAECPEGTFVTGGGYTTSTAMRVYIDFPEFADAWVAAGFNPTNQDLFLRAYAVCAGPMP